MNQASRLFPVISRGASTPIAANIVFRTDSGVTIKAGLDFAYPGKPTWDIALDTAAGQIALSEAATVLSIDGRTQNLPASPDGAHAEYAAL